MPRRAATHSAFGYNRAAICIHRLLPFTRAMNVSNTIAFACAGLALTAALSAGAQPAGAKPAAAQPAAPAPEAQAAGNADAGRHKASMCVGCHNIPGYKTAFPAVYSVPKLDGQHAVYIVSALRAYKSGERRHPSMRAVAASLSDQDMADLAAFYSSGPAHSASR
jgi:cytochrome c553